MMARTIFITIEVQGRAMDQGDKASRTDAPVQAEF